MMKDWREALRETQNLYLTDGETAPPDPVEVIHKNIKDALKK
jgi:hypothetical protein